jgi:fructose-specific phosphotransferase system IIC component
MIKKIITELFIPIIEVFLLMVACKHLFGIFKEQAIAAQSLGDALQTMVTAFFIIMSVIIALHRLFDTGN